MGFTERIAEWFGGGVLRAPRDAGPAVGSAGWAQGLAS